MANTSTSDINIFSGDNGGEMAILSNDLVLSESLYQVIYISLFGGNIEASTTGQELSIDERFDWWGNSLLFNEQKDKQFNSETQRVLDNVVLNSEGRLEVKQAVENDLVFLKNIVNFDVSIFIESSSRISIGINILGLSDEDNKLYTLIWDNARNEVIIDETL